MEGFLTRVGRGGAASRSHAETHAIGKSKSGRKMEIVLSGIALRLSCDRTGGMKSFPLRLLVLVLFVCGASALAAEPVKKLRVLFIGNSLTSTNDLPNMLAVMAESSGRELTIGRQIVGGATLEKHWNEGKALAKIKQGPWDYVVLQDLSRQAYTDKEAMLKFSRLFDAEIRQAGARTAFYMTWPLEDSLKDYKVIADAYASLASELKALLIPVGVAWHEVANENNKPVFQLYKPDHKHPAPPGTYLAACVFYRTLYGVPSTGLPNRIEFKKSVLADLSKEDAAALQKIADGIALTAAK